MKGSHIILTKKKEDMPVVLHNFSKMKVRWCLAGRVTNKGNKEG